MHVYRLVLLDIHTFCAFLSNKNPHTVRQRQIGVGIEVKGSKNSARSFIFFAILVMRCCTAFYSVNNNQLENPRDTSEANWRKQFSQVG
jgi:hypothetical protein